MESVSLNIILENKTLKKSEDPQVSRSQLISIYLQASYFVYFFFFFLKGLLTRNGVPSFHLRLLQLFWRWYFSLETDLLLQGRVHANILPQEHWKLLFYMLVSSHQDQS